MLLHPKVIQQSNGWWMAAVEFFPGLSMESILFAGGIHPKQEGATKAAEEAVQAAEAVALDVLQKRLFEETRRKDYLSCDGKNLPLSASD